jgi:two-component system CheB/CheR fusion protein
MTSRVRLAKRHLRHTAARRWRSADRLPAGSFPIVGIGASAGGYEAFTQFLKELPPKADMAVVLIQHLDPRHGSKLSELLARSTRLPILEVERPVRVVRGHVYVIPPNKNLSIFHGVLKLTPRRPSEMPPMPVDLFMRTLAKDQGANAIGIVLSGNGSDGTLGLEAIKGADGLTLAQDPKTASYPGMPESAIASGCVDLVLPPDRLAHELLRFPRPAEAGPVSEGRERSGNLEGEPLLGKIYAMLRSASGVDFARYKQTTLKRRLARRMVVHRLRTLAEYLLFLQAHPVEVTALFDDMLIAVTRFFRDPKLLSALARNIFPALVRRRPRGQPIRIWVPGCSTGEEVYSLAISLLEFLGEREAEYPLQIFGTDVSEKAIARARAGLYRPNIALDVSPERLRRFFTTTDEGYRVSNAIRERCVFARQDLCSDPPFSRMDLISCQNVMIYFGRELQQRIIGVFHYALQPNGFLLLSSAESISGLSELFSQTARQQRIYVKTMPLVRPAVAFGIQPGAEELAALPEAAASTVDLTPSIEQSADRVILQQCAPAGVVVDHKLHVVQFRGFTAPYLQHTPGAASLNLLKMVSKEMAMCLRAVVARALAEQGPAHKEIEWNKSENRRHRLKVQVIPFKLPPAREIYMVVLFHDYGRADASAAIIAQGGRSGRRKGTRADTEVERLRQEVETVRSSFQAAIEEQEATNEELKSANEELQSSNEELQSTNEELETTKEEMQSTNEELSTVNEELQESNQEANRLNNDFNNLLASVQIPVVIVDNGMALRRYTPAAQKFFAFIPTDIGRNLTDIKSGLDVPDLDRRILEVIETLHSSESQVRDNSGHWYSLRVRPYRTKDHKIDGAVISLYDIDEIKREMERLSEVLWEPFVALDKELRVVKASEAFYRTFQTRREETEGRPIYSLGEGQWNIPALRRLLEEILPAKNGLKDFAVEHAFPGIGLRKMLLNASRLSAKEPGGELILLAFRETQ